MSSIKLQPHSIIKNRYFFFKVRWLKYNTICERRWILIICEVNILGNLVHGEVIICMSHIIMISLLTVYTSLYMSIMKVSSSFGQILSHGKQLDVFKIMQLNWKKKYVKWFQILFLCQCILQLVKEQLPQMACMFPT